MYPTAVSRLRRPFLSERFFFLTVNLLQDRSLLDELDFAIPRAIPGRGTPATAIPAHRLGVSARSLARHPVPVLSAYHFQRDEVG
jgi:hypothetical protein